MFNDAILWQISMSIKVVTCISALALSVSEILMLQMFDFECLGQCQRIQRSFTIVVFDGKYMTSYLMACIVLVRCSQLNSHSMPYCTTDVIIAAIDLLYR